MNVHKEFVAWLKTRNQLPLKWKRKNHIQKSKHWKNNHCVVNLTLKLMIIKYAKQKTRSSSPILYIKSERAKLKILYLSIYILRHSLSVFRYRLDNILSFICLYVFASTEHADKNGREVDFFFEILEIANCFIAFSVVNMDSDLDFELMSRYLWDNYLCFTQRDSNSVDPN